MFSTFFTGIILGLVLSLMTGTTFVALLNIALFKGFKPAISFAFGVFLSDIVLFLVVFLGIDFVFQDSDFYSTLSNFGGILISLFGVILLIKPVKNTDNDTSSNQKIWKYIIQGLAINIFNPLVYLFWIGISAFIKKTFNPIYTSIIALITMFLMDIFKSFLISNLKRNNTPRLVYWLNILSGSTLIIVGIRLFLL